MLCRRCCVLAAIVSLLPLCLSAGTPRHPLDALTAGEYWAVFETMKASDKLDAASRYAGINLHEPPKAEVLRWKPGEPFRREALAIVKQGRRTFEAVVDVTARNGTRSDAVPVVVLVPPLPEPDWVMVLPLLLRTYKLLRSAGCARSLSFTSSIT